MQRILLIIIALVIANPASANCDNLLKKWATSQNTGKKIVAQKIFKKIIKQCITKK